MAQNDNAERIDYWIALASYDLETAEAMLKTGRYLYVGFMCHQTIEKTLKALFAKNSKGTPPFRHNLAYIAREASVYDLFSESKKDFLDELEPLNIESRYPATKEMILHGLSQENCRDLLGRTKEVFGWLKSLL